MVPYPAWNDKQPLLRSNRMIPNSLEEWFLSPEAKPIWQNALDRDLNERTITAPEYYSICPSMGRNRHAELKTMGITYKCIPWK
jgi:hypothetical protein